MNILHICTGYDISFNGGITNYVRNISSTLVNYNHNVTVLYSQNNGKEKVYNFKTIDIKTKLKPFHLSSIITNSDIDQVEKIIKEISPEIIHVHMMIDLPLKVLELFKKYAKVVISLHDYSYICNRIILLNRDGEVCVNSDENKNCNACISYEETIDNRIIGGGIRKLGKLLKINKIANSSGHYERFKNGQELFSTVDSVIAVSNRVKELYENNEFTNNNFVVNHIGNYTAEDEFRNKFKNRRKISSEQKIKFGFIGNLTYHKGAEVFMKFALASHHEFHVYGGIEDGVLKLIEKMPNVFYHGRYSHEQLVEILQNIDFGMVLSIWEDNAPQVVFEFLNAGIPVLGTRMGGIPDFVNEKNGILFDIDTEQITDTIRKINSEEIYEFYNKIINTFEGTKKAKQHMEELLEIYNRIL